MCLGVRPPLAERESIPPTVVSYPPVRCIFSFDIDGTLEVGDPPGPVTLDLVRRVKGLGHVIGSCSDRTLSEQANMWARNGIEADFTSLKYQLPDILARFPCQGAIHVGDSHVDRMYAEKAGFTYLPPDPDAVTALLLPPSK